MKFDEITKGEIYAYSKGRRETTYFSPGPGIVLAVGGWVHDQWIYTHLLTPRQDSKESLVLVQKGWFGAPEEQSTPMEIAKQYTLDQATAFLASPRGTAAPEGTEPPAGWMLVAASPRTLHMLWEDWIVEAEQREADRAENEQRIAEEDRIAEARAEHIISGLAPFDVVPEFHFNGESIILSYDQAEKIVAALSMVGAESA